MPLDTLFIRACTLSLCWVGLSACDSPPTQVDQYFGLSVQQAQLQQTQNLTIDTCPIQAQRQDCQRHGRGSHHPLWHEGRLRARDSDGETAQSAIQRYQESFASPSASMPTPATGLGTGSVFKR